MSTRILAAPSRYVQGPGVLAELGTWIAKLGSTPLILAGETTWKLTQQTVTASFEAAGLPCNRLPMGRYATAQLIDELTAKIGESQADVIIGMGGGSAIDAVKAAGDVARIKWASVPTIASTDAPCSALSVVYTDEGVMSEYRFFPKNPDLVLIDTQLVADAPVRFLVAGMGDALATWPEARVCAAHYRQTMAGGGQTDSAVALAKLSWDLIHANGLAAIEAVKQHVVTPAVERIVEANTLLSGLGFESAGLAAAHAIHDGLTAVPQTHGLTHGEKVNIGTLSQLVLEGRPSAEIEDFIEFTTRLGLPNTLTEIGLSPEDIDSLTKVAEAATIPEETIHNMPFPVAVPMVVAALRAIEGLSRSVRAARGLPEPVKFLHT